MSLFSDVSNISLTCVSNLDGMLNSTTWLYGAEVLPIALRSRVMGLAAASHFIVNVGITEAGPSAFSHVSLQGRRTT